MVHDGHRILQQGLILCKATNRISSLLHTVLSYSRICVLHHKAFIFWSPHAHCFGNFTQKRRLPNSVGFGKPSELLMACRKMELEDPKSIVYCFYCFWVLWYPWVVNVHQCQVLTLGRLSAPSPWWLCYSNQSTCTHAERKDQALDCKAA